MDGGIYRTFGDNDERFVLSETVYAPVNSGQVCEVPRLRIQSVVGELITSTEVRSNEAES